MYLDQSMDCRQRLSYWAENRGELAPLVFNESLQFATHKDRDKKVALVVGKYLKSHEDQLGREDLPILKKFKKKPVSPAVRRVIIKSITSITKQKPLQITKKSLSTSLSAEVVINLCVLKNAPSLEIIKETFANMSFCEIEDFAVKLFERFNENRDVFMEILEIFLTHAPLRIKMIFFIISGSFETENNTIQEESLQTEEIGLDLIEYWKALEEDDILNIEKYLALEDALTLFLLNKVSSSFLAKIFEKCGPKEISNFSENILEKFKSDPEALRPIIRAFFSNATIEIRTQFLSEISFSKDQWVCTELISFISDISPKNYLFV